ncbi:integrase [Mesorhizobium carmichaelinearum]|uniref:integrase n=1 Tax=Mesorhizobium carmichaelinearum TaxID=1208188 RepID=UPI000BA4BFC5|nr:integrase [Mesorhizobium carmichaelinearum]
MDSWRQDRLVEAGHFPSLAMLDWNALRRIEIFPGCRLGDPILQVPETYLPPGAMRRPGSRRRDPSLGGKLFAGVEEAVARHRDENVRRALLVLWLPHDGKRGGNGLGPSSWLTHSGLFLRAVSYLIEDAPPDLCEIWGLFHDDRRPKFNKITSSKRSRDDLETIYQRLRKGAARGFIPDLLGSSPPQAKPRASAEQSHKNPIDSDDEGTQEDEQIEITNAAEKEHFDDQFVVEIIGRSIWIIENIAEKCIQCWSNAEEIAQQNPGLSYEQVKLRKNAIVSGFDWYGDDIKHQSTLPFKVRQRVDHQRYALSDAWPPKNYGSLALLIGLIQALDFTLLAFCTAARHHEISGTRAEVKAGEQSDGRMHSRTHKMKPMIGGEERDWPLHPMATRALALQEKLASVIRPEGKRHLWVQFKSLEESRRGGHLANMTEPMVYAVDHLGLTEGCNGRPHGHRWRHTVTRLVALAVVESMQLLLDLLGHADFEHLLAYLLSNPDLSSEVMETAAEASIVLASTAIEEVLDGRAGGPAAATLKSGLEGMAMRRGIEAFGTDDRREAAEILTANGTYWGLVRPGIICTKAPGQFGACTKGRGAPDKGGCRADCAARLELELAKAQCRQELLTQIDEYSRSTDYPMAVARLKGQILANLHRWEEVREEMVARFEIAGQIWRGVS